MYKITAVCDKCKAEATTAEKRNEYASCSTPKGWQTVVMKIGQYEEKNYLLCPECRKSIGLLNEEKPEKTPKIETVEERLFNVIAEIVHGVQGY
jgi:thymidine kinase